MPPRFWMLTRGSPTQVCARTYVLYTRTDVRTLQETLCPVFAKEALKMDIVDLQREEFNHKYDEALHEAADYAEQMGYIPNQEGLWDGKLDS